MNISQSTISIHNNTQYIYIYIPQSITNIPQSTITIYNTVNSNQQSAISKHQTPKQPAISKQQTPRQSENSKQQTANNIIKPQLRINIPLSVKNN